MKTPASIPPFARIVADLRARIEAGELAPGDRLPSTRALAKRWGVALATATKALAALKHEGLVVGLPRVGTVVARSPEAAPSRPRRSAGPETALSRPEILRMALSMADAEGLDAVSMRSVASKLGVPVMSLYRHVHTKDDLVLGMVEAVFATSALPAHPPAGWRAQLELIMRLQWALYRRHPWLGRVLSITRPQLLPRGMQHSEWILRAVSPFCLSPGALLHVHLTVINFVRGVAINLEAEREAEAESGLTSEQWIAAHEDAFAAAFASGQLPHLTRLVTSVNIPFDLDSLFAFGMERLLDGLALFLEKGPS